MNTIYNWLTLSVWLVALGFPYEPYTISELFAHLFFIMALILTCGGLYDYYTENRARKAWELEIKSNTGQAEDWHHKTKSSVKRTFKRGA